MISFGAVLYVKDLGVSHLYDSAGSGGLAIQPSIGPRCVNNWA